MSTAKYSQRIKGIYASWQNMISRCYNPRNWAYKYYGGKGVIVCDEWKNDYESFLKWSLANGWEKGMQIDKDIKGNGFLYSPETCLWVTQKVNAKSRINTIKFDYKGTILPLSTICDIEGMDYLLIYKRIFILKMPLETALKKAGIQRGRKQGFKLSDISKDKMKASALKRWEKSI